MATRLQLLSYWSSNLMNWKTLGVGLIGCVIGAACTYVAVKKHYDNKVHKEVDKLYDRDSFKDLNDEREEELEELEKWIEIEHANEIKRVMETEYASGLWPMEEEFEDIHPREITEELFFDTELEFEKLEVRIYSDGAIICADDDGVILPGFIGEEEARINIEAGITEWYVRNPPMHTDFHIKTVEVAYNEMM